MYSIVISEHYVCVTGDDEGEEVMGTRLSALSGQDTALRTVVKLVAMHPRFVFCNQKT